MRDISFCARASDPAGCAETRVFTSIGTIDGAVGSERVVLMPLDIELFELTAGGLLEPKDVWTSQARRHVTDAISDKLQAEASATMVMYVPPADDSEEFEVQTQLMKLHDAVGNSILLHKFSPFGLELPTKKDTFDWSLGESVQLLGDQYAADYALFVFVRDSYSSGGRTAIIFAAALFGVGIQGGSQVGFASLVDLDTGEISWFSLLTSATGDLRTPEPARQGVDQLLKEFPL